MKVTESIVEQAALDWLKGLDYEILPGLAIAPGEPAAERADYKQVFLFDRLRTKLEDLNPKIPPEGLEEALRKVRLVSHPTLIENNRAFHRMLVEGVDVEFRNKEGQIVHDKVWLIDFANPEKNEFLAINQFTVEEGHFNRRADVVVFINGLPLAVLELKNIAGAPATVRSAFNQLQTYKAQIPSLFKTNALLVISDGVQARLGTVTSDWERFMTWRTITGQDLIAPGSLQLETMLKGVFDKTRLLDLIRNFIVFEDDGEKVIKKIAGYHQFHAVNKAVATTVEASRVTGDRRAGVIWHTQGSGKSLSMVFYAGKIVQHPAMENPTIVVLTDRNDLDNQLFDTFSFCAELLRQKPIQAASRRDLRELLNRASGGVIFTTIQKFMPPDYRGGFEFSGLLETARKLRQEQTPAEDLLWALLRNRQLCSAKFRRQHQFGDYICDLYCHDAKLVVECDGKPHSEEQRRKKDAKRDAYLRALGLTVVRFENKKVLEQTETVLAEIAAKLAPASGHPSPAGRGAATGPADRHGNASGHPSHAGRGAGGEGGALSNRRNIVVIADEAHRSQYDFIDGFARHMRDALPKASFIGFTGTPIESGDKNTQAVFGDYIDVYDILQAKEDRATVPIYYEARLAKIELKPEERPKIDPDFAEVTEDAEESTKESLRRKWAQIEAMVGTDKRIALVAEDLVNHWEARFAAMEGKAMIVCMSRRICVELYKAIQKLRPDWHHDDDDKGAMKIVMSGTATDKLEWQQHIRSKKRREELAKKFKDPKQPFKIVIVRDMWLTGFDAPCLHTMYLDKPMRSHGLMQAIARVNRVFKDKPGGLVVDYLGLAEELKLALADYTNSKGKGEIKLDQELAVAEMLKRYEQICILMHGFDFSAAAEAVPAKRFPLVGLAANHVLQQEDGKQRYLQLVSELSKAFALSVPHESALEIRDEVGFFQEVRAVLAKSIGEEDGKKSPEELEAAVRQIVSRAISSDKVIDIFDAAGLKRPDISILSDEFLAEVQHLPQRNLAVELLQKLLHNELKIRAKKYLVQSRSFAEMLEATIRKYQNRTIEAAQVIAELIQLAKEMREGHKRGLDLGLTDDEVAFYDALEVNDSAVKGLGDAVLKKIAQELVAHVRKSVTIDWTLRESARAQIRVLVRRILRKYGYPPDKQEKATQTVLEQAELICAEVVG
ncbi:MAG: box helicase [Pedosphaera sp.]|nr:box helicase [Pedosphaera sp.]